MKPRLLRYLAAAFNARPWGMFVPPNWVGIAGFAILGTLNWGFWLLGAGLELAYLFSLTTSPRFQKLVDGRLQAEEQSEWGSKLQRLVASLDASGQHQYSDLEARCRSLASEARTSHSELGTETQRTLGQTLSRLLWVYLQLLVTRQATIRLLPEGGKHQNDLEPRIRDVSLRLQDSGLDADLKRSLEGQLDLLNQRQASQREARLKLDFIDSELVRIEEQVNLVRDQALLASDAEGASARIDAIASTLGSTTQWIRDQSRLSTELAESIQGTPPPVFESEENR